MRLVRGIVLVVAACLFAASASSAPRGGGGGGGGGGGQSSGGGLVTVFNPDQMVQVFEAAGFKAEVVQNGKTKMVRALLWPDHPDIFAGAFGAACDNQGQCPAVTLFANTGKSTATANWLNSWNGSFLFVRAFTTPDGELIFKWDMPLIAVPPEYVAITIKVFKQTVDQSGDFNP
jgi:putative sensory transduction regulator